MQAIDRIRALRARRRAQHGGYFVEAFFDSLLVLFFLFLVMWITVASMNVMVAHGTQAEEAIYLGSSGTWTGLQAERCIARLPGPVQFRECTVDIMSPANPSVKVRDMVEICGDPTLLAAQGMRLTPPQRQPLIGDCLNDPLPDSQQRFVRFEDTGGQAQPLRLTISYRQWFINFCPFLPQYRDKLQGNKNCRSQQGNQVSRSVVVYSQTRRES